MRRVVAVLPSLAGGGAERVTLNLLRGLDAERHELHLILLDGRGPLLAQVPPALTVTDLQEPRLRHALPALLHALRRLQPQVTFSSLGYVNLALAACRWAFPGALLIREANLPSLSLPRAPRPGLTRFGYRLLYPRADRVLATSRRMADELAVLGVAPDRLTILPNPVDIEAVRHAAMPLRRQPGPGQRFVAAGRLVEQKGFDRLIPLMRQLPEAQLTIFGEGPQRDALMAQAREGGVAVSFAGFSEEIPQWFAGADAVLMPSRWEGMPNVALEALACGTPVIASPESGGIAEIAEAASAGAVQVAAVGQDFADCMARVTVQPLPEMVKPSLLPPRYAIANVVSQFAALIAEARK